MYMRICKKCKISQEYNYLTLNSQGKAVYKDENGGIWHGKTCYSCFKQQIKSSSHVGLTGRKKIALKSFTCVVCGISGIKKAIKQTVCSKTCYKQKISV